MRIILQDDDGHTLDVIGGMNRNIIKTWVELVSREEAKE